MINIVYECAFMCTCVRVCMCHMYPCWGMYAGQRSTLGVLYCPLYFLRQGLSLNMELPLGFTFLCPLNTGVIGTCHHIGLLCVF